MQSSEGANLFLENVRGLPVGRSMIVERWTLIHSTISSSYSGVKGFSFLFWLDGFCQGLEDVATWLSMSSSSLLLVSFPGVVGSSSGRSSGGDGVSDRAQAGGGGGGEADHDDFFLADCCFLGKCFGEPEPDVGTTKPDVLAPCLKER